MLLKQFNHWVVLPVSKESRGGWCQNLVHGSGIETKKYDDQCTSNRIKQRKTAGNKMTNQTVRWMETITQLQAVEVWPCGHN